MRSKLVAGFMLAVVAVMFIASGAMAAKMLCVSNKELKGDDTVAACVAKGDRFAIVNEYGIVHIMTPEEVELTKAFNPKALQMKAFGFNQAKDAPIIPLPPRVEP